MVISTFGLLGMATVDDGEVIPVANTPPRPPPPLIISFLNDISAIIHADGIDTDTYNGDIEKNIEDSHRSMYQVQDQVIGIFDDNDRYDTSINGELKEDRMYRVDTILSSIVLLLLQSGCIVNDDTIAIIYCYNYFGNNK